MNLPNYQSRVQFQPVNVGGMFQMAFTQARASALAEQENQRKIQQEEEDRLTYGPLKLEATKLGLESQKLGIESQRQSIAGARQKAEAENSKIALDQEWERQATGVLQGTADIWNTSAAPTAPQSNGVVPVTFYSSGAAVGGPDESQDKWTNKGYSSSGQNLTEGIVAVNTSKYPLGTIFRDDDSGEVFIAGDRHGNANKDVVDIYKDPSNYKAAKENRNLRVIGTEKTVPKDADGIRSVLDRYRSMPAAGPNAAPGTDMSLEEYPFDPATGNYLSPAEIAARKNQPTAPPKHLEPIQGPPDFQGKLKEYNRLTAFLESSTDKKDSPIFQKLMNTRRAIALDPIFTENLKLHEAEQTRQIAASQLGMMMTAANPAAAADFKATYAQWSGVTLAADAQGGYHPVKADGSKLSAPELAAFSTSWQGFVKDWKPGNSFRMNSEQSRSLTAFKSAEAVYKLNPADKEATAKYEGAKAALVALGTAAPEFGRIVAGQLPMPAPAPKADAPPAPGVPPADAPLSLDSIPMEDAPDNTAANEEWSMAKDKVAEQIGAAFNPTAADGKIEAPTRLIPELTPETVKATLTKKGPLTEREKALMSTLRKARAIITDEPVKTGTKTRMAGFGDGMKGAELDATVPAADFYAKGMKPFTIDGKEVQAPDVLRAWAEEVLTRAGIPLKQAKGSAPIVSEEVKTEATKFRGA